jgi:hypothetical protein
MHIQHTTELRSDVLLTGVHWLLVINISQGQSCSCESTAVTCASHTQYFHALLPEGFYCHQLLFSISFPSHHTAEYSIDEAVVNSKLCLPAKSPRKWLLFATLYSLLHWAVEVVGVNQNIQVPNKDKNTSFEPPHFWQWSQKKNSTRGQGKDWRNM